MVGIMRQADTMVRVALFVRKEQQQKLQKLSERTGAPLAELIRRAIDAYLKERAKEAR
jgi:predicted DNA-binding protein